MFRLRSQATQKVKTKPFALFRKKLFNSQKKKTGNQVEMEKNKGKQLAKVTAAAHKLNTKGIMFPFVKKISLRNLCLDIHSLTRVHVDLYSYIINALRNLIYYKKKKK